MAPGPVAAAENLLIPLRELLPHLRGLARGEAATGQLTLPVVTGQALRAARSLSMRVGGPQDGNITVARAEKLVEATDAYLQADGQAELARILGGLIDSDGNLRKRRPGSSGPVADGVQLPVPSGSTTLHQLLLFLAEHPSFYHDFEQVPIPRSGGEFAARYDDVVTRFEAARIASPRRVSIARAALRWLSRHFLVGGTSVGTRPVDEAMLLPAEPLPLREIEYPYARPSQGLPVSVSWMGRVYETAAALSDLAERLERGGSASQKAAQKLRRIATYAFSDDRNGYIDLTGRNIVLLGGLAELSPLQGFLQAGATVFTTHRDRGDLDRFVESAGPFGGRLLFVDGRADLLTQTARIAATVRRFAEDRRDAGGVVIGALAYAGGQGREARLAVAMDAVIRAAGDDVSALFTYLSPSMPMEVDRTRAEVSEINSRGSMGGRRDPNILTVDNRHVSRSVAPFQGASYFLGQWWKVLMAEVYGMGMPVSANVAPVTRTSSMNTPFLRAAMSEAGRMGIEVPDAADTRSLMGLLAIHDLLGLDTTDAGRMPSLPEPIRAHGILAAQVDGGVFTRGRPLSVLLRRAGIVGNLRRAVPEIEPSPHPLVGEIRGAGGEATWVLPRTMGPDEFERLAAQLGGPLAGAIAGGEYRGVPVRHLFLGDADQVPSGGDRLMALRSALNQAPTVGAPIWWVARAIGGRPARSVRGGVLTSQIFGLRRRGDIITIRTTPALQLQSVHLRRPSGEGFEWRTVFEGNGGPPRLRQVIHYGRRRQDGTDHLAIEFTYDARAGSLRSTGPTAVNRQFFLAEDRPPAQQVKPLGGFEVTDAANGEYARLTRNPADGLSVTLPSNAGILRAGLAELLRSAMGVDFSRVTVHGLEFERLNPGSLVGAGPLTAFIRPIAVDRVDKGELLEADIVLARGQQELHRTRVGILVRGNLRGSAIRALPRIGNRRLANVHASRIREIEAMGLQDLVAFAALNGDTNPLHEVPMVGQAAGFQGVINPGFGTFGQIEAAIRASTGRRVVQLGGTIIRPALPGRTYKLVMAPKKGNPTSTNITFQLVDGEKVLVDGSADLDAPIQQN